MKKGFNYEKEMEFLKHYDIEAYERPSVSVDLVAFTLGEAKESNYRKNREKRLKILLMKRKTHPFKGFWALPGGFVGMEEELEEAAQRVMEHKTDLKKAHLEQLYTWGGLHRDPRHRILSISYLTLIEESNIEAKDEAKNYEWVELSVRKTSEEKEELIFQGEEDGFSVELEWTIKVENGLLQRSCKILKNEDLAFDHAHIIAYALRRVREKIEYSPLVFSLLPERFTLTELQQVYELILNRELLKANFRRKIAPMVVETEEFKKDAGHRPSKYYRFNDHFFD